ncbi:MAG: response regulator [Phormidesmis sp.]
MFSSRTGRVLILEIDYGNRILFADYLEQCGYSVCTLSDGQKILEGLKHFQPDVLILNLRMPVVDGFTIIEQLRQHSQWQRLAILVVSGYTLITDQQKAFQLGANAYLTKPVLPSDLSETVAKLINEQR